MCLGGRTTGGNLDRHRNGSRLKKEKEICQTDAAFLGDGKMREWFCLAAKSKTT